MGTDWRNYDPDVEPFVEIFQGDRHNYERPDAPRTVKRYRLARLKIEGRDPADRFAHLRRAYD